MQGAGQVIYSGQGFSQKGEKNRFVLPPAFRKAVAESSDGKVLCLAKHERPVERPRRRCFLPACSVFSSCTVQTSEV